MYWFVVVMVSTIIDILYITYHSLLVSTFYHFEGNMEMSHPWSLFTLSTFEYNFLEYQILKFLFQLSNIMYKNKTHEDIVYCIYPYFSSLSFQILSAFSSFGRTSLSQPICKGRPASNKLFSFIWKCLYFSLFIAEG